MHILCPLPASTIIPLHPQIAVHNQLAHYQNGPQKFEANLKEEWRKVFTEERYKNFLSTEEAVQEQVSTASE
jgi:hypothetical protein